jgi:hypothetical protein
MIIKNAIPKSVALVIICVAVSFLAIGTDSGVLAKADSMSSADFIAYVRGLHHHSFLHHFVLMFISGGMFVAGVEFIAYVIGLCFKKKPAA